MQGLKNEWGKFPPILIILIYSKEMIFISKAKFDRTGETFVNNQGHIGTIVKYVNKREVYAMFEECIYPIKCEHRNILSGGLKNPFHRTNCGVGYIGQGEYGSKTHPDIYHTWSGMMTRCYGQHYQQKFPSYIGCAVCEEWHNFQNFAKWYEENYYEVDGERTELDKDILIKGNKIYSPETCCFSPRRINSLIVKSDAKRGNLPIGIYYYKQTNKYKAQISIKGERTNLGYFNTPEEAFQRYKEFKEEYIKQVAEEYRDRIPQKLYEAMNRWEVEITD